GGKEVSSDQAQQRNCNQGVGRDMKIEINEGMNQNGREAQSTTQHERRFVAPFCGEIVLRTLEIFPATKDFDVKDHPNRAGQEKADHAPVGQRIDVVIVNATGAILQGIVRGAVWAKANVKVV